MKNAIKILVLCAMISGCSAERTSDDAGPATCKYDLIFCAEGFNCNYASDVCEPCGAGDAATCEDAGPRR